ncbi:MAG TPA: MBL fold metallo-hydrolase, partial [Gemmatimonadaceae bacterium]
ARTTLAALEATLARGADSTGRRLTDSERRDLQKDVAQRRNELVQIARVRTVPPNLVFERSMSLDLGNRRVELRDMGRANSPHDVVIWLPDERVLFTGDILVHPLPFTGGASPLPWIDVLREVEKYPVASLVPGHGPVMSDHRYTTLVRETFELVRAQIDSGFRAGYPLVQIVPKVKLESQRAKFVRVDGSVVSQAAWDSFTRTVAQFLGECYQGYRC